MQQTPGISRRTLSRHAWTRFRRTTTGPLSLLLLGLLTLCAMAAPLVGSPFAQDYESVLSPPSLQHLLGTDDIGRDTLSRTFYGARISLGIGALAIVIAVVGGVPLGLVAGYYGRGLDAVLMRVVDGFLSFPSILLALFIAAVLGPSLFNIILAIGLVFIPRVARFTRGQALVTRGQPYVEAALAIGQRDSVILRRYVLLNIGAPLIIQVSLDFAYAILIEASLSFLGIGTPPPSSSWGTMLQQGFGFLATSPRLAIVPGLFISMAVLGASLLGDAARDALDPRLRTT